jgi:broad specificity phosphatase PhoE
MVKLYLIRHAQATGNLLRLFQGTTDTDLTDEGKRQLRFLTERFRDIPIDIIASSDLHRAMLTAAAVNTHHRKAIVPTKLLREIDGGEWEGCDINTFPEKFPEESRLWEEDPAHFAAPGGETMEQVFTRVSSVIEKLKTECDGKSVAVVSHGCAVRNMLCYLKYGSIEHLNDVQWSKNTGVTCAEFTGGVWKIWFENDISHLPEEDNDSFSGRLR